MTFDIEKEAEKLLKQLRTAIPRDENGYCADFLYLYKNASYLEDNEIRLMEIIVARMQIIFDKAYYYMFIGEEERNAYKAKAVLDFRGRSSLSGRAFCHDAWTEIEPLESWEQCLNAFDKLNKMCSVLDLTTNQSPSFANCLFILWAFFNYHDWTKDLTWLVKWLEALCNVCQRAASADFDATFETMESSPTSTPQTPQVVIESPTTPPQVITQAPAPTKPLSESEEKKVRAPEVTPRERTQFMFELCEAIIGPRGSRKPKPFRYTEKGFNETFHKQEAVFEFIINNLQTLSNGTYRWLSKADKWKVSSFKTNFAEWERAKMKR